MGNKGKNSHLALVSNSSSVSNSAKTFSGGSGGGSGGDMEVRLTKVEGDVATIKSALGRLEPIIGEINTRTVKIEADLKHTPKTIPMVFGMLTIFAMGYIIPQMPSRRWRKPSSGD